MTRLYGPDDSSIGQIHDQLRHLQESQLAMPEGLRDAVPTLTREQLSELIGTAFWTSLRNFEGRPIRVCLTVASLQAFAKTVAFQDPVSFEEAEIVRLVPALPRSGSLVVLPHNGNSFRIVGIAEGRPVGFVSALTIESIKPGVLRIGAGPFNAFAVLEGRSESVLVMTGRIELSDYLRKALRKELPQNDFMETQAVWRECICIAELAKMVLGDQHGGIILVVPDENGAWRERLQSFPYRFAAPDTTLRAAIRRDLEAAQAQGLAVQELSKAEIAEELKGRMMSAISSPPWTGFRREIRSVAHLAGIDGALVITKDARVLGFGAKIGANDQKLPHIFQIRPEPGEQQLVPCSLESTGGMRHQSAVRFAAVNRDALSIVVSQDGHMSVAHWEPSIDAIAFVRDLQWWV